MDALPTLELYVTRGCGSCRRAERVLRQCKRLSEMVTVQVLELGTAGVRPPAAVIGAPSVVFSGTVVALGTPDCSELADRLKPLIGLKR